MTPIVMRLHECSDRFENGRIFLPVDAPMTISSSSSASRAQNTATRVDSTAQASDHMREDDVLAFESP
jgi:hypothetical protein